MAYNEYLYLIEKKRREEAQKNKIIPSESASNLREVTEDYSSLPFHGEITENDNKDINDPSDLFVKEG